MAECIIDTFGIVQDFADLHGDMSTPLYQAIMDVMVSRQREEIVRCRDCACAVVTHPLNPITGVPAGIEYWRCDHFWNADELCEVDPDGFCAWACRRGDA